MNLSIDAVANLFDVSTKTIYRWTKVRGLPAYRIGNQYRFNRTDLLEWATAQRVNVSPDLISAPGVQGLPRLADALAAGGIHYRIGGREKRDVLAAVVDLLPLPEQVNREDLLQVLLAREELGSTAIGDGIAIPHSRNPIVINVSRQIMALCFLEEPIEFDAMDGKPVNTLFLMVSSTTRAHLHLLSRLSFALRDPEFKASVVNQGSREEIIREMRRIDSTLRA